jgi:hypothetical protein
VPCKPHDAEDDRVPGIFLGMKIKIERRKLSVLQLLARLMFGRVRGNVFDTIWTNH